MRKMIGFVIFLAFALYLGAMAEELLALEENVIRFHVVGASNSSEDQNVKLRVRDAVYAYLQTQLATSEDIDDAREVIRREISAMEKIANITLAEAGFTDTATISFGQEEFPKRIYDSFSLPAGVYESLRIQIGGAEGKNWWCVVFPSFCLSASSEELRAVSAGAGFSDTLINTLTDEDYEIRFWMMDCLGMIQNFFHWE